MPNKIYVFGYGSLVCPDDIAVTLGRAVEVVYPATQQGWIRDWSVVVDNRLSRPRYYQLAEDGSTPNYVVALNVRRPYAEESATNPNGVLFEVSSADLVKLDTRECDYARVDVTEDIVGAPDGAVVYTYTGLPEHLLQSHSEGVAIVPQSYANLVANGFTKLGADMYAQYVRSTQPAVLKEQATRLVAYRILEP